MVNVCNEEIILVYYQHLYTQEHNASEAIFGTCNQILVKQQAKKNLGAL